MEPHDDASGESPGDKTRRREDRLLSAFIVAFAGGVGSVWFGVQFGYDLALWTPITIGIGAVLGYLCGPDTGYLFLGGASVFDAERPSAAERMPIRAGRRRRRRRRSARRGTRRGR